MCVFCVCSSNSKRVRKSILLQTPPHFLPSPFLELIGEGDLRNSLRGVEVEQQMKIQPAMTAVASGLALSNQRGPNSGQQAFFLFGC